MSIRNHTISMAIALMAALMPQATPASVWMSPAEIKALPMQGAAWEAVKSAANKLVFFPNLSDQNDPSNVRVLAKALVAARTGEELYIQEVIDACMQIIGTEIGGSTLALGRELAAYVIAADIVGLPPELDQRFRSWLRNVVNQQLEGGTLRQTFENRPNNWGTHAGGSLAAVAAYLGDRALLGRVAIVLHGWLGNREAYAGFKFRELWWQSNPENPVAINPPGAMINGFNVDGVLPDDQRRSGEFRWPPPKENYVYEALQGILLQAVILNRQGYPVWKWQNKAILRAYRWLYEQANYQAQGDDTWQLHLINYFYGVRFPTLTPSKPGKNIGFTDWTHQRY